MPSPTSGGGHRVGDERHPVDPGRRDGHAHGGGVQVDPVGDQLDGHAGVVQERADRTWRAVVQWRHPVEQVRADRRARVHGGQDGLVAGVAVPDRGGGARVEHLADGVHATGQLRCQRDHPRRCLVRG